MTANETKHKTKVESNRLLNRLVCLPLHPFLLPLLLVIAAFGDVRDQVLPEELIPTVVIVEVISAGVLLLFWGLSRNWSRSAIACSLAVGLFMWCYVWVACPLDALSTKVCGQHAAAWLSLTVFAALSSTCVLAVFKTRWIFRRRQFTVDHCALSSALNIVALVLCITNTTLLVMHVLDEEQKTAPYVHEFNTAFDNVSLNTLSRKPDVYYVIVDGFANPNTMKEFFNCTEDKLFRFLEHRGFYVVPEACSNYDRTEFSLTSSLSMQFINSIPDRVGKNSQHLNLFCRVIQNSAVLRLFRRLGYRFYNVSTGASATGYMPSADRNFTCTFYNYFSVAMARLTPIDKCISVPRDMIAEMRLCAWRSLSQIVQMPKPKFVLVHTEISHAPPIFDDKGHRLPLPPGFFLTNWGTRSEYAGQWRFSQDKLISWLSRLMASYKPDEQPIIIIQSDHGPNVELGDVIGKDNTWYNQRMRILNAYYFPGDKRRSLYPTITPVNSFRVLFNDYFQAKLPLLPDKVWCSPNYALPYNWSDVRSKIRFPAKQQS